MMNTRFFGFNADSSTPIPPALTGVNASSALIHFGIATSASAAGRAFHSLTATANSRTPSTSFNQNVQSAGAPSSSVLDGPISSKQIVPAAATPTIQPSRNENPFTFAFGVININTIATIGVGLIATPTAHGNS